MRRLTIIVIAIILLITVLPATAQDEETPSVAPVWLAADEADDTDQPRYVTFLFLDDGETILEVGFGADVIYTLEADGTYSGAPLVPNGYEFSATLTLLDDQSIHVASETSSGIFTNESDLTYTLADMTASIWLENPREIIDFSKFGECIGREPIDPPGAFADADPILLLFIDEDTGELRRGPEILTGDGTTFEVEIEGEFGEYADVTTLTAVVNEDTIDFTYYSIAGGRADCVMHYVSSYTLFDGDVAGVMERIEAMEEEEAG